MPSISEVKKCLHCGDFLKGAEEQFCCPGCRTVFSIIQESGLSGYYDLRGKMGDTWAVGSDKGKTKDFSYLDDFSANKRSDFLVRFYLEGVQCAACLWLLENLGQLVPGVDYSRLKFGASELTVKVKEGCKLSDVASMLYLLGYTPHLLNGTTTGEVDKKKDDRSQLLKIGVAAACSGNIMLLSISMYGGANGDFLRVFSWLSALFFIPVSFYCAIGFYRSAWGALKMKKVTIDTPVSVALLSGTILSFYNLVRGSSAIFFDTISVFVFLLLGTRFLLKKAYEKLESGSQVLDFLIPEYADRWDPVSGSSQRVRVGLLDVGDEVLIKSGDVVPADGLLVTESAFIDGHLLTGEALPVALKKGDELFAGSANEGRSFLMKVTAVMGNTYLKRMMVELSFQERPSFLGRTDVIAKWFLWGTLALSGGLLLFDLIYNPVSAFSRSLALLIVACPCALSIAAPLTYTLALKEAEKRGICIKNPDVLEKITKLDKIYLDKTGTLTKGRLSILDWVVLEPISRFNDIVFELEKESTHPVARVLRNYVENLGVTSLLMGDKREILGEGVSGVWEGSRYELKARQDKNTFNLTPIFIQIGFFKDGRLIGKFDLGDELRESTPGAIQMLRSKGLALKLLSGDSEQAVQRVATVLGLEYESKKMPLEKSEIVANGLNMMVGDGANDAAALKNAFVSVAVQGSLMVSLASADIYFTAPGIGVLPYLFDLSRRTMKILEYTLAFSIFYNCLGAMWVVMGRVSPLVAAILMPISSLTVLLISLIGMRMKRGYSF